MLILFTTLTALEKADFAVLIALYPNPYVTIYSKTLQNNSKMD